MAKAINWPLQFREEVLAEDETTLRCAVRLGELYYENRYWVPDEVVDIRVNHLKVRKGIVVGDLKKCVLSELEATDYECLKTSVNSETALVDYLSQTYNQPVDKDTVVTLVYYRNHVVVPDEVEQADDPHM